MPIGQPILCWRCRGRSLEIGKKTLVMGILNVTPDSFFDGGRFVDPYVARRHALQMVEAGADIIDIGGESTRPGSSPVSAEEELERVLPAVQALAGQTNVLVSIDTTKARVAGEALAAGAHIVNDVSALTGDPGMAPLAAEYGAGVVIMHMQGRPATMQKAPSYRDVVTDVREYFRERVDGLVQEGLDRESLVLDPGIGFGKTVQHNLQLVANLPALSTLGRPILVGVSRKSFLGALTGRDVDDRLSASLGAMAYALTRGAHIIRVHDVKESCDVAQVVDSIGIEELTDGTTSPDTPA